MAATTAPLTVPTRSAVFHTTMLSVDYTLTKIYKYIFMTKAQGLPSFITPSLITRSPHLDSDTEEGENKGYSKF